jgi:hypothetical protein|tara:strand:+ start:2493 stop:3005 length:513 start_codon:yes stop_codon:yes gene_type:complete
MPYLTFTKIKEYREANTPDKCPILGIPMTDPVLDHCHRTGLVRGVISREANSLVGKVENFFYRYCESKAINTKEETVYRIAKYLENYKTNVLHPVGLQQLCRAFKRMSKKEQYASLKEIGAKKDEIKSCKNQKQRVDVYRTLLKYNYEREKHTSKTTGSSVIPQSSQGAD